MTDGMNLLAWLELLSYLVTVVGLPLAIYVFIDEQRKRRENEEKELNQRLADDYTSFLHLVLDNADLKLFQRYSGDDEFSDEQKERRQILFALLISVFERAHLTLYEKEMGREAQRRWLSWEDYMRDWCRRPDFRDAMPVLLEGEDDEFSERILAIAHEEQDCGASTTAVAPVTP